MSALDLSYFLKGLSPNPASRGMMGSTYDSWGTSFSLTLEAQLVSCGTQQVHGPGSRTGRRPLAAGQVAEMQWSRGMGVVGADLPEFGTLVPGGGSLVWG